MIYFSSAWRSPTHAGSSIAALVLGTTMLLASPLLQAQSSLAQLDADTRAAADETVIELEKSYVKKVNRAALMNACVKGVARGRADPKGQPTDDNESDYCLRSMISQLGTNERYFNLQQAVESHKRKSAEVAPVRTTYPAPNIAMIEISAESGGTLGQLAEALEAAKGGEAKALILDLRGYDNDHITRSAALVSAFLPLQALVATVRIVKAGKNEEMRVGGQYLAKPEMVTLPAKLQGIALSTPLVVLVDERTGGTAEVIAAALQDHHRATIVGRETAGKAKLKYSGSVLHGGSFSITVGEFTRPSGKAIDGKGVAPDRVVAVEKDLETALALLAH